MTEGTKIGEADTAQDQTLDQVENAEDLESTKIGQVSEFEKELFKSEAAGQKVEKDPLSPEENYRLFEEEISNKLFNYEEGDVIIGSVRSIEKRGALVDFKYKSDGFIANSELGLDEENKPEVLEAGQEVRVYIEKLETKEGYAILSRRKAQLEESLNELIQASKDRDTVLVKVQSKVQGGLVASYKNIRGFIPASQVIKGTDNLEDFVGQNLEAAVLQVDDKRRKVIFSHKAALRAKSKRDNKQLLDELEVGEIREGVVTSIKDFGVFVDLGGVEGLVHISELSWSRVSHPSEFVNAGDKIKVFVLGVDKETRKISLGLKQLEPDPWVEIAENFSVGQIIKGTITRITTFGAFVALSNNIEGLIHISELSYDHVEKVEDVVKVGDEVEAKIIKLIVDEQKIGLTLKGLNDDAQAAASDTILEETEAAEPVLEESTEEVAEESADVTAESSDDAPSEDNDETA